MEPKKALLLVNIGTPDKPEEPEVASYLGEFLGDRRILSMPWLMRKILVNRIIVPKRAPKSTALYQKIWTPQGSPLLIILNQLVEKLQKRLEGQMAVYGAMRYGNPSVDEVIGNLTRKGYKEINIFPLFPHYATSTTESALDAVKKAIARHRTGARISYWEQFYSHPAFLDVFARKIEKEVTEFQPDFTLFSYHGLPVKQVNDIHRGVDQSACTCTTEMPPHGHRCYKATCYETTRLLASRLRLDAGRLTNAFQSRFAKNWLAPFADETLAELATKGVRRALVVAPSFVADCLETLYEIEMELRDHFIDAGGQDLRLVKSLNADDAWADALVEIIGKLPAKRL